MLNSRKSRSLFAVIIALLLLLGFSPVASAHSYSESRTCAGVKFTANNNYEGNAANNSLTITLDGQPAQVFNFNSGGIDKSISWPALKASHSGTWKLDANINSGDAKKFDASGSWSVGGCEAPTVVAATTTMQPTTTTLPVVIVTTTAAPEATTTAAPEVTTTTPIEATTTAAAAVDEAPLPIAATPNNALPETGINLSLVCLIAAGVLLSGVLLVLARRK